MVEGAHLLRHPAEEKALNEADAVPDVGRHDAEPEDEPFQGAPLEGEEEGNRKVEGDNADVDGPEDGRVVADDGTEEDAEDEERRHHVGKAERGLREDAAEEAAVVRVAADLAQMRPEERAAVVEDDGEGVVDHFVAATDDVEAEDGVLARPVARVEAADLAQDGGAHEEVAAWNVVDLAEALGNVAEAGRNPVILSIVSAKSFNRSVNDRVTVLNIEKCLIRCQI